MDALQSLVNNIFGWWFGLPPISWANQSLLHLLEPERGWVFAWFIPLLIAVVAAYWRVLYRPDGPRVWDVFFRPRRAFKDQDKLIVFDLLLAALVSDLGFLTLHVLRQEPVGGGLAAFWVLIAAIITGLFYINSWGYEPRKDMEGNTVLVPREDFGIILPNIAGILALVVVYGINT